MSSDLRKQDDAHTLKNVFQPSPSSSSWIVTSTNEISVHQIVLANDQSESPRVAGPSTSTSDSRTMHETERVITKDKQSIMDRIKQFERFHPAEIIIEKHRRGSQASFSSTSSRFSVDLEDDQLDETMPRRAVRTKTAPLPSPDVIMAQCRDEADSGRTILSVRDRSRLLMSAALSETNSKRRGSTDSERRGSVGSRKSSVSAEDRQTGDELTGMSLAEKMKIFSNQTPRRVSRRQTQPIRLEDLVRAEQMTNQQENIPAEEPCANVGSFVKQWERRTSVSEDQPRIPSGVRDKLDSENSSTQGSPLVRRRASRSILKKMQSFEGNGNDGEPEEAENRPPSTADSVDKHCSRGHWAKNDAVARRRSRVVSQSRREDQSRKPYQSPRKLDRYSAVFSSELSCSSPPVSTSENNSATPAEEKPKPRPLKAYGSARHSTQPITKMELSASEDTSICRNQTIRERLANMKNASESWKGRVSKDDSEKAVKAARASLSPPPLASSTPQPRTKDFEGPKPRSVSTLLADRKSQLEESQKGWKDRVEEKDANKFTVEGKIRSAGIDPNLSPQVMKRPGAAIKRGSPRAISFHGRPSIDDGSVRKFPLLTPKSPSMRRIKLDENEDIPEEAPMSKTASIDEPLVTASMEERRVEVPSLDFDQVTDFLSPSKPVEQLLSDNNSRLEPESMESCPAPSPRLKCVVRTTRPPRRRRGQGNPVRRKNERTDIFQTEYTETLTGVVDREQRRMEVETKASESKTAALASRENIAAAMEVLKRADGDRTPARDCLPYKSMMLLHVKGQRRVQVRLVEPCSSSMNSGDCFILVTPKYVFAWIGSFSNRMEQRRALDLANLIVQRKGLGVRSSDPVIEVQEAKPNSEAMRLFWLAMGHSMETDVGPVGELDEDLRFEQGIQLTNAVYEMQARELVPCEAFWGKQMKKEMLDPKKAFVLDFGSELYVWLGMHLSNYDRRRALALGRKLYQQGYDYRGCGINPLFPLREPSEVDDDEEKREALMFASTRPSWSIFGRISQNMETLLFTAKFFDWPDTYGSKKAGDGSKTSSSLDFASSSLDPVDADRLINERQAPARTELEGTNLMRGGTWTAYEDGLRRTYTIDTRSVDMWLASDFEKTEVKRESLGQFSRQSTYVVRWQYRIYIGGRRNEEPRASGIGRERFVYFYWLGRDSSLTDKTASALLTVELDTEKGPQQCVVEGKEPPAFCRLFPLMTVHDARLGKASAALFIVRGDEKEEGHLSAVPAAVSSLRSRATFLLLDRERSAAILWHGQQSPEHSRDVGRHLAARLSETTPSEFGARVEEVREVEEGEDDDRVTELLGTRSGSLPSDPHPSLRLWRFSSVTGELRAAEIPAPLHHATLRTPLPYLQSDIYGVPQPTLFLIDGGRDFCFLWHGWWNQGVVEDVNEEEEEDEGQAVTAGRTTGSARSRHNRERLAALKTAVHYGEKKYGARHACRVIYGGLETQEFRELFPWWTERPEAAASQRMEGRSASDELQTAESLLDRFLTQRFPASRLASRPLPEGVDPLFLEHFLEDSEFKDIFRMTREDFLHLPQWKKIELKKDAELF